MPSPFARADRLSAALRVCVGAVHRRLVGSWWRELLLIGVLYGAYEVSRGLGDVNVGSAIGNGRDILHLERVWHLDPERVLNDALHQVTFLAVIASYFYSAMHYLVTPAVLIWMYRRHREHYGFARTALAISTGIGLIGYLFLPTAPPRMLAGSGLRDILADTQRYGWWGNDGSVPRGLGGLTNQFAAMPSLHVGWAVWCGAVIALNAQRRWVRVLGVTYPLATTVVVMATGNHYLLDAIAGCLTMALGALLAHAVPARFVTVPMGPGATMITGAGAAPDRPAPTLVTGAVTADRLRSMTEWELSAAPDPERASIEPEDKFCRLRR